MRLLTSGRMCVLSADVHTGMCSTVSHLTIMSSPCDASSKQGKKKAQKKRKKCFVGSGSDLLVVDEETGCRLKELLTRVLRDMLPKDATADVQSDERVAGGRDESRGEEKWRDRNNRQHQGMHEVKKHFVLGVNEIVKSISRSSAVALLLTTPLQTHLQVCRCRTMCAVLLISSLLPNFCSFS